MRPADRLIDSARRPTRTNGPDTRPSVAMGTAYASPGSPSRSESIHRNCPSADHAGLSCWNLFPVTSIELPPATGKSTIPLGASFPKRGPGSNATQLPDTQAIHTPVGDHTHE